MPIKPSAKLTEDYGQFTESLRAKYSPVSILSFPLPPATLRAQNQGNRFGRGAAIKDLRKATRDIVAANRPEMIDGKVRIHHVWFCAKNPYESAGGAKCKKKHKMYRPQDEGNAIHALKPIVDGIVDAGLLRGDTHKDVCFGDFIRLGTAKENFGKCGLLLFIEVLD